MNLTNYDALTDIDLRDQLRWEHYILHWTSDDRLELFTFGGGYQTTRPYREQSAGEVFDSVEQAHRWVFTL